VLSRRVIAIDGPAGAGKSTVAKRLARALGIRYLDTGAMYRALALKASRAGLGIDDSDRVADLAGSTRIEFGEGDPQRVLLDGEDVTEGIRTPQMSELASALSTDSRVRRVLVQMQRDVVEQGDVVLEGRDATTVIAPDATLKVYLTASLEERARRRHLELDQRGLPATFETVRKDVELRDHRDITRDESPLTVAADAHILESGGLDIESVVQRILDLLPTSQQ
jgi:CMP/dCMP kinase